MVRDTKGSKNVLGSFLKRKVINYLFSLWKEWCASEVALSKRLYTIFIFCCDGWFEKKLISLSEEDGFWYYKLSDYSTFGC